MANIIRKENQLNNLYLENTKKERDFSTAVKAGAAASAVVMFFNLPLGIISAAAVGAAAVLKRPCKSEYATILENGLKGEENTANFLATLPAEYQVITNAKVSFNNYHNELDFIVVGPSGVFVIENKNLKGSISGSCSDTTLVQTKVTSNGNTFSNKFRNPVKQVRTHTYTLSNYLASKGIDLYVQPIVFFSNEDAQVNIDRTHSKAAIFAKSNDGEGKLFRYISNYKNKAGKLDAATISRIVNAI